MYREDAVGVIDREVRTDREISLSEELAKEASKWTEAPKPPPPERPVEVKPARRSRFDFD